MSTKNYWAFRVDKNNLTYVKNEINEGRLRQGWGWDPRQNLANMSMDEGAGRNKPMYNKVKKGDILLIPRIPNWDNVTIVEATEDWNLGYRFEIDPQINDLGHIFPAKIVNHFTRGNRYISGKIRATLGNLGRFWNINSCAIDIEKLLNIPEEELSKSQRHEDRFFASIDSAFIETFKIDEFNNKIYNRMTESFQAAEWESALVAGLKVIFPKPYYNCQKVGNSNEEKHGSDILIRMQGLTPDFQYGIAIQVKDYTGIVSSDVIDQINKSENHWLKVESRKIIEKIVILTKAEEKNNLHLINNSSNVRFIFSKELKELLGKMARKHVGIKEDGFNS